MDKMRTELTKATVSIKTGCHTMYIFVEGIALKLIFGYYSTLAAGLHQVM